MSSTRTKRTYNLSQATVQRVREMAERYGVAPTQDAVVELAVDELERRLREEQEASAWEEAATDASAPFRWRRAHPTGAPGHEIGEFEPFRVT